MCRWSGSESHRTGGCLRRQQRTRAGALAASIAREPGNRTSTTEPARTLDMPGSETERHV